MRELFSDPSYYDFPRLTTALYSLLLSFSLSTLIAFTYQYTFRGVKYSRNFFQAMVLSSMVAAILMMAIGDSLARGLGILGALAIIRFRNRIRNPKNIIFIFSAISVGIACGVHGYTVAVAGALIFCFVAILLYHSPYGRRETLEGIIALNVLQEENEPKIRELIKSFCEDLIVVSLTSTGKEARAEYNITLKPDTDKDEFFRLVKSNDQVTSLKLSIRENIDRV